VEELGIGGKLSQLRIHDIPCTLVYKTYQSVCFSKCFSHQQLELQQFSAISNTPSACNPSSTVSTQLLATTSSSASPSCFPASAAFYFVVSSESHPETKGKKFSDRVQCMDCGQGCMRRDSNRKRVEDAARLEIALPFKMTFIKMINDATYRIGNR
jgi:hypothetical protein